MHQNPALKGLKRRAKDDVLMKKPAFPLYLPDVKFTFCNNKYDGFCGQIMHLKGLLR